MRNLLLWMAAALAAMAPGWAFGCSPMPDYRMPTNFELVQRADVIALVRVTGPAGEYQVGVEPVRFLKGSARAAELRLRGLTEWEHRPVRPYFTSIQEPHYSAAFGMCVRMLYPKGGLVLALYERDKDGALRPSSWPFTRMAEDVTGDDDPWVHAVERYLTLQAGGEAGLKDRVRVARATLLVRRDPLSQGEALDLGDYLAGAGELPGPGRWSVFGDSPGEPSAAMRYEDGASWFSLDCRRGRPASLYVSHPAATAYALRVGARVFEAPRGRASHGMEDSYTGDFPDPAALMAALAGTVEPVAVLGDGKVLREALPGDALYRWAGRCAMLGRP